MEGGRFLIEQGDRVGVEGGRGRLGLGDHWGHLGMVGERAPTLASARALVYRPSGGFLS